MLNGITLIALVISIIVMLILAGVSINAVVGDNGILTRTQYASFLNEMSAVEEAVQLWKAGETIESNGEETKAIPANGLCKANELTETERLVGEVGYYRIWSMSETQPTTNILNDASTFNSAFESELVFYPAGVQDLYYLNNEALGIKEDKTYLIDAATGMIYSMTGIGIKGVRCYSSNMAKAVMNGESTAPLFAEAEVSGTGSGEKLAGEVNYEYIDSNGNPIYKLSDGTFVDANGNVISASNVIENENYNPNGFQIIASQFSDNIYKLYNTGELWAKGVKGSQLNTDNNTMNSLNELNWGNINIPSEIGTYKQIICGAKCVLVIDSNDYLWAFGENQNNKFALNSEQLIEYTTRDAIRLKVGGNYNDPNDFGEKVSKVFELRSNLFVVTKDGRLYGSGANVFYNLGLGNNSEVFEFTEITVQGAPEPAKLVNVVRTSGTSAIILEYEVVTKVNNTDVINKIFYSSGRDAKSLIGDGQSGSYTKFCPIWNGYTYKLDANGNVVVDSSRAYKSNIDIADKILDYGNYDSSALALLFKTDSNNSSAGQTLWFVGFKTYMREDVTNNTLTQFPTSFSNNVEEIYPMDYGFVLKRTNGEYWAASGATLVDCSGMGATGVFKKVVFPNEVASVHQGIKEARGVSISDGNNAMFYLCNDGTLYASGGGNKWIGLSSYSGGVDKLSNAPKMTTLYNTKSIYGPLNKAKIRGCLGTTCFLGQDNLDYSVGCASLLYRNDILQKNWEKVTDNVKSVTLGSNNSIGIIKRDGNLYVAGEDTRILGLNSSTQSKRFELIQLDNSMINGIVKQVTFSSLQMFVLTTTGKLYATGLFSSNGTTGTRQDGWAGWADLENKYTLTEILTNVRIIETWGGEKIALTNDNKLYTWGMNYGGTIRLQARVPTPLDVSSEIDVSKVVDMDLNYSMSCMILNNGDFYTYSTQERGRSIAINSNTYTKKNSLLKTTDTNGNIIDSVVKYVGVTSSDGTIFVLTTDGKVWAWGYKQYMGINNKSTTDITKTPQVVLEDVEQLAVGNKFAVAVKKDGTVWGTGSNQYGILGRWVGIDRKTPNSRYQTAFEWVECPELEL